MIYVQDIKVLEVEKRSLKGASSSSPLLLSSSSLSSLSSSSSLVSSHWTTALNSSSSHSLKLFHHSLLNLFWPASYERKNENKNFHWRKELDEQVSATWVYQHRLSSFFGCDLALVVHGIAVGVQGGVGSNLGLNWLGRTAKPKSFYGYYWSLRNFPSLGFPSAEVVPCSHYIDKSLIPG